MDRLFTHRIRQFFATIQVPCPYLPERTEQKLVLELRGHDLAGLHTNLSRAGFRRSHHLAYRPACQACNACVPMRVNTESFHYSRSMRRIWRHQEHLIARFVPPSADAEHFALFQRYVQTRHGDSDMAQMDRAEFSSMMIDSPVDTWVLELRDPETHALVAACLCDRLGDGVSAVYSYFEPDSKGSIGSHIVLRLIEAMRKVGKPYVYLGFWIDGSQTMTYKRRFPGVEALKDGEWQPMPRQLSDKPAEKPPMAYWLFKTEPGTWSWDDQVKKGTEGEGWNGVRNHQAANNMKAMKVGDLGFFYHSVNERQIVGIVEVIEEYHPDPTDAKGKFGMVRVQAVKPVGKPVSLAQIKQDGRFDDLALVRQSRLSVVPVSEEHWRQLCEMAEVEV
jgi:leucyl-tRNA---protein transferase